MYTSTSTGSVIYDTVITKSLNIDIVPQVYGDYILKQNTYSFNVDSRDLETFQHIYELSPPIAGETEGNSKGSGKGELALYWLFQHQTTPIHCEDSRSKSAPDLKLFGEIGCEVKSYSHPDKKLTLGRFGEDRENIKLLNTIFSFYHMSTQLIVGGPKKKETTSTNFRSKELLEAFKKIYEFITTTDIQLEQGILSQMRANVNLLIKELGYPSTAEEAASRMLRRLINIKLDKKPGDKGYMVNVKKDGSVHMFYIDLKKLDQLDTFTLFNSVEITQCAIQLNFNNIF